MAYFSTLDGWLEWQKTLHPNEIDLGLERVAAVLRRLKAAHAAFPVIAIAGTNGKGSTLALLAAIYRQAGYKVGCFTSPHLYRYNERICIDAQPVSDHALCEAFNKVEAKRGTDSLTYFEFSALAAYCVFSRHNVDIAFMEVGLGGRLDAVNAFDLMLSVVTTVDIDHTEWLGDTREAIAYEKAGIFRADCPAVCGVLKPPASLLEHARKIKAKLYVQGVDFSWQAKGAEYCWTNALLPMNFLLDSALEKHQQQNLSTALMVIQCLQTQFPVDKPSLSKAVQGAAESLPAGRMQILSTPENQANVILDVAHNRESVAALAEALAGRAYTKITAVFSALSDKRLAYYLQAMDKRLTIKAWHIAELPCQRAMPLLDLQQALAGVSSPVHSHTSIWQAYQAALSTVHINEPHVLNDAGEIGEAIVVFGSFYTVTEVMQGVRDGL